MPSLSNDEACDISVQDDFSGASRFRSSCSAENLRHLPFLGMTLRLIVI
jgi:hypothetical protein